MQKKVNQLKMGAILSYLSIVIQSLCVIIYTGNAETF